MREDPENAFASQEDAIKPRTFFFDLLQQYESQKNVTNVQHGKDYGTPRSGYDAFSLLWLSIQKQALPKKKEVVTTKIC